MAGVFGAVAWEVADVFGSNAGVVVMAILTAAAAVRLCILAQRNKVGAADLDRTHVSPEREAQLAAKQPAPTAA
jgi:hypothetical protein